MPEIKVKIRFETEDLQEKFSKTLADPDTMLEVHQALYKHCDPYVPMRTGALAQTVDVTPEHVVYKSPYAHYLYEGIVYGPNIPIIQDLGNGTSVVVGYFSPPGQKKHPTGRDIEYSHEQHPLADSHWDKHMMDDKGDEFTAEIKEILIRRMKNG